MSGVNVLLFILLVVLIIFLIAVAMTVQDIGMYSSLGRGENTMIDITTLPTSELERDLWDCRM